MLLTHSYPFFKFVNISVLNIISPQDFITSSRVTPEVFFYQDSLLRHIKIKKNNHNLFAKLLWSHQIRFHRMDEVLSEQATILLKHPSSLIVSEELDFQPENPPFQYAMDSLHRSVLIFI